MKIKKIIATIVLLCLVGIGYYSFYPAINIHQQGIWLVLLLFFVLLFMIGMIAKGSERQEPRFVVVIQHIRDIPLFSRIFV